MGSVRPQSDGGPRNGLVRGRRRGRVLLLVAFPTGDQQAKMVGNHQPVTLAAMEGKFVGGPMAGVAVIGQPNVAARRLDNPIEVPGALSFLAYGHFGSYVHGLDDFPRELWPDNI